MDMSAITGLAGSLKAAGDIAKALIDVRDAQLVQAKVIELQREIMAAQGSALAALTAQSVMIAEIDKLRAQIAELETWNREKARYQLTKSRAGMFSYVLKDEAKGADPPHRICSTCYQKGEKSILHVWTKFDSGNVGYRCMSCDRMFSLDP